MAYAVKVTTKYDSGKVCTGYLKALRGMFGYEFQSHVGDESTFNTKKAATNAKQRYMNDCGSRRNQIAEVVALA